MVKVTELSTAQQGRLKETLETKTRAKKGKQCKTGKPCGGSCISKKKTCGGKPKTTKKPKPTKPEISQGKGLGGIIDTGKKFTGVITLGKPSAIEKRLDEALVKAQKDYENSDYSDKAVKKFSRAFDKYIRAKTIREEQEQKQFEVIRNRIIKHHGKTRKDTDDFIDSMEADSKTLDGSNFNHIEKSVREVYQLSGGRLHNLNRLERVENRAWADEVTGIINVGRDRSPEATRAVMYHEMGHFIEYSDRKTAEASRDFLESRSTAKEIRRVGNIFDYRDELNATMKGDYIDPYVGRVYGIRGKPTEVVSMGVERFSSSKAMRDFYEKDPEHFYYTVGVLLGAN